MNSSSCDPVPVENVLTDFNVEVIKNPVLIEELSDIYLVMNMPNLKSAKFIFINLDLSKMFEMLDIKDKEQNKEVSFLDYPFILWFSTILPALSHYCRGMYMDNKSCVRNNRKLDDIDFTFELCYNNLNMVIRLNGTKLIITEDNQYTKSPSKSVLTINLSTEPISCKMFINDKKVSYHLDEGYDSGKIIRSLEYYFTPDKMGYIA